MQPERLEQPVYQRLFLRTQQLRVYHRTFRDECTELNKMNGSGEHARSQLRQILERWANGQSRQT